MTTFVRKLTFKTDDLGVNADLILTFDSGTIPGIYKDYFPTAWKVCGFWERSSQHMYVTYRSQLAFIKPVLSPIDVVQPSSPFVSINVGQSTTLTKDSGVYKFSDPVTNPVVPKTDIQCENDASSRESIGVGFIEGPGHLPDTALLWEGVGSGSSLPVEFTPILRGHVIFRDGITSLYKDDEVLRAPITTPAIFEQNLTKLKEDTTWILTYDDASGEFFVTEA